jgi:hypothetical protein
MDIASMIMGASIIPIVRIAFLAVGAAETPSRIRGEVCRES